MKRTGNGKILFYIHSPSTLRCRWLWARTKASTLSVELPALCFAPIPAYLITLVVPHVDSLLSNLCNKSGRREGGGKACKTHRHRAKNETNSEMANLFATNKVLLNSIMYAHNQPRQISTFPFDTTILQRRGGGYTFVFYCAIFFLSFRTHFFFCLHFENCKIEERKNESVKMMRALCVVRSTTSSSANKIRSSFSLLSVYKA